MPRNRRGLMSYDLKVELARQLGAVHKIQDGYFGELTAREAGSLVRQAVLVAEKHLAGQEPGRPAR